MRRKIQPFADEEDSTESLINLTPLIDVVFVVLITYILIAPVLNIDPVDLAPSGPRSKKEAPAAENAPIAVSVHADNTIWLQERKLTIAQLELELKNLKTRHPKSTPQLAQDNKAQFGTYQAVKNAMEAAGFEQMDVILKPNG